jgi:hypothetical protein
MHVLSRDIAADYFPLLRWVNKTRRIYHHPSICCHLVIQRNGVFFMHAAVRVNTMKPSMIPLGYLFYFPSHSPIN